MDENIEDKNITWEEGKVEFTHYCYNYVQNMKRIK